MSLVLVCLSVAPLSAEQFGLFTYRVIGDTVKITDYPTSAVGDVEIPSEIEGKPVTSIGRGAFGGCSRLTSVTIPSSVTNIGSSAFVSCTGLTSITIPEGVTSIGVQAFRSCSRLTIVTIPESVISIGGSAFYGCTGLTSITIPSSVTSIGGSAFRYSTSLTAAVFHGDAPVGGATPFSNTAPGFTIYYLSGSSGFDLPPWDSYPATLLGLTVADVSVSENEGNAEAVISMSGPITTGFRVDYATNSGTATAGSDFTAIAGTAEIPAGQSQVSILIPITDDNLVEGNEMFTLTLSNPVGAGIVDGEATVTIEDNDAAALTIENADVEESVGMAPVVVRLSNPSKFLVRVDYGTIDGSAKNGSDYTAVSGNLSFTPGQTERALPIPIIDDTNTEKSEQFTVTLSNATGVLTSIAKGTATITIEDDDPVSVRVENARVLESDESVLIPVSLNETSDVAVSVDYTLIDGTAQGGIDWRLRNHLLSRWSCKVGFAEMVECAVSEVNGEVEKAVPLRISV